MAGWTLLKNDCADIINRCQDGGCCLSLDVKDGAGGDDDGADDDSEDELISMFDRAVSVCLNEAADRGCIRPLPALHGDGQPLDLFKIFLVVRRRGGFDLVSGFWTFVAKELGLDAGASAAVKLVYFKYLYDLERWLKRSGRNGRLRNEEHPRDGSLGLIFVELERHFRSFLSSGYAQNVKNGRLGSFKYKKNGKQIDNDVGMSKIRLLDTKNIHRMCNGAGNRNDDDEIFLDNNSKKCLHLNAAKKEFNSRKRKREPLARMLNWLIQIAKCPDDPSIGKIPPQCKWKDHGGEELWVQAIRARNTLLQRRQVDSTIVQSNLQNSQRMHPSMYEDTSVLSDQPVVRPRCSKRLPALMKPELCSCCNSSSDTPSKLMALPIELGNGQNQQQPLSAMYTSLSPSGDEQFQRHVAVGPRFQAVVPEWTGMVSKSDSKWLGTRVWPLERGEHNASVALDAIGKGRPDLCGCQLPSSVACIRFHTAERRMKLKLEVGPVFYQWKFDRMGEEVSLRWTADEERRFKAMVRLNPPSLDKCFWDDAHKYFPRTTREELVSYYFNVFLVRRRGYQNRVTPKNIDSDDDESDFGSLSDGFGHEAVMVPGANILICSENMQCSDFK